MKKYKVIFIMLFVFSCFSVILQNKSLSLKTGISFSEKKQNEKIYSEFNNPGKELIPLLSSDNNIEDDKEKKITEFVKSFIEAYQIPGLAYAIIKDNKIYKAEAYGVKNYNTKEPLSVSSVFHFASVSKPFSATAIMQLVEQGKMKLDDPLIKYLPYFKLDDPNYKDITIKQMLTHTSGIPDVHDYEWNKPQYDDGAAERYVRSLSKEKMIFKPGEKWQYSNMAFDILADVIAKVSGMSFEDYIKEKILNPLEMYESNFLREKIRPELRVSAHVLNLEPQVSEVYPYNRCHAPSSCLNANVIEMCNWAIANMNKGIFKEKRIFNEFSYKLLFEAQVKIGGYQSIGLSWFLDKYRNINRVYHGGGDLGFRSHILMLPEKSIAVVIASNYEGTQTNILSNGLVDIMLGFEQAKLKKGISIILSKTIKQKDVDEAIKQYHDLRKNNSETYDFSEAQLNSLGYQLLNRNQIDDAIKILKLNVEMFPNAFNTYDSLGEAYILASNKKLAMENYKKSIELNPKNANGIEKLRNLEAK